MESPASELTERQLSRLRAVLSELSVPHLHRLAQEYGVEIPLDAPDIFSSIDILLDELSLDYKKKILGEYGDAGRKSTYIFISEKKTPPIQNVFPKAQVLLKEKPESELWEHHAYYDEVEVDHLTRTIKIRFHYLKGVISTLDEAGRQREHRLIHSGVTVYRPGTKILEIRVPHKSMAIRMAIKIPTQLGLSPFISLDLMGEELIKAFVDWISSLNSATIELPISDVAGSIKITARKGMDLKTSEKFYDELKHGRLRGGHVTIERSSALGGTNFRIFFRDCHIKYTLFTSEEEIAYVIDALEKIAEGYRFDKPDKILTDFLGKKD